MHSSRSILPIRSLVKTTRVGRRQRLISRSNAEVTASTRLELSNRAVAIVSRPVWLRGPLFQRTHLNLLNERERHAA